MQNCLVARTRIVDRHLQPFHGRSAQFRNPGLKASTIGRASNDVGGSVKLESTYLLAESTVLLTGALMLTLPEASMQSLLPVGASAGALTGGVIHFRLAASSTPLLAAMLSSLADADVKGNLVKSATYRKLNTACLVTSALAVLLTMQAYLLGDNMGNGVLLGTVTLLTAPVLWACVRGAQAQGLQEISDFSEAFLDDAKTIKTSLSSLAPDNLSRFYQFEASSALLCGIGLLLLPVSILEALDPSYTGDVLMQRIFGAQSLLLGGYANTILIDASQRGRLGASTFKNLNIGIAATSSLVTLSIAAPSLIESPGLATLLGVLLSLGPSAIFAYQGVTAKK